MWRVDSNGQRVQRSHMTRPHEDRGHHHTLVDHRIGGPPIIFTLGDWCAINVANVQAERVETALAAYETLIEEARRAPANARAGAVLRSINDRRVVSLVGIGGHDAFAHLKAAWDDHHLVAEHKAVAESNVLALYQLAARVGETAIDPASSDAYAFERVTRSSHDIRALVPFVVAAPGFVGALVFGADDEDGSAILYRFRHRSDVDSLRASGAARDILGEIGSGGDSAFGAHPVKTIGA
jgi:hypothetical protein